MAGRYIVLIVMMVLFVAVATSDPIDENQANEVNPVENTDVAESRRHGKGHRRHHFFLPPICKVVNATTNKTIYDTPCDWAPDDSSQAGLFKCVDFHHHSKNIPGRHGLTQNYLMQVQRHLRSEERHRRHSRLRFSFCLPKRCENNDQCLSDVQCRFRHCAVPKQYWAYEMACKLDNRNKQQTTLSAGRPCVCPAMVCGGGRGLNITVEGKDYTARFCHFNKSHSEEQNPVELYKIDDFDLAKIDKTVDPGTGKENKVDHHHHHHRRRRHHFLPPLCKVVNTTDSKTLYDTPCDWTPSDQTQPGLFSCVEFHHGDKTQQELGLTGEYYAKMHRQLTVGSHHRHHSRLRLSFCLPTQCKKAEDCLSNSCGHRGHCDVPWQYWKAEFACQLDKTSEDNTEISDEPKGRKCPCPVQICGGGPGFNLTIDKVTYKAHFCHFNKTHPHYTADHEISQEDQSYDIPNPANTGPAEQNEDEPHSQVAGVVDTEVPFFPIDEDRRFGPTDEDPFSQPGGGPIS